MRCRVRHACSRAVGSTARRRRSPTPPQADAAALAECPNFWVPRDVLEGRAPALAATEQVVQALYARLVAARLAPLDDAFVGAEYWCQVYEGGRGLGFHFDKVQNHCSVLYAAASSGMVVPLLACSTMLQVAPTCI